MTYRPTIVHCWEGYNLFGHKASAKYVTRQHRCSFSVASCAQPKLGFLFLFLFLNEVYNAQKTMTLMSEWIFISADSWHTFHWQQWDQDRQSWQWGPELQRGKAPSSQGKQKWAEYECDKMVLISCCRWDQPREWRRQATLWGKIFEHPAFFQRYTTYVIFLWPHNGEHNLSMTVAIALCPGPEYIVFTKIVQFDYWLELAQGTPWESVSCRSCGT